jgi:hypothetical protein
MRARSDAEKSGRTEALEKFTLQDRTTSELEILLEILLAHPQAGLHRARAHFAFRLNGTFRCFGDILPTLATLNRSNKREPASARLENAPEFARGFNLRRQ